MPEKNNYNFYENDLFTYLKVENSEKCREACEKTFCVLRLYLIDLKGYEIERKKLETQKAVLRKAELAIKSTSVCMIEEEVYPGSPKEWSDGLRKKLVTSSTLKSRPRKTGEFFNL